MQKYCVYTVLLGDYETLIEQPVAKGSSIDFICFTDDKRVQSETWNFAFVDPILPLDPARSSRVYKICPHRFLTAYETSLYIDNKVLLRQTPEVIFAELASGPADLICMAHSFRDTVFDEFQEVIFRHMDDLDIILEQFIAYDLLCPEILDQKPPNGGFIIRHHHRQDVIAAMETWFAQVLRYSKRDQLSFNYALKDGSVETMILDLDIRDSRYNTVISAKRRQIELS